VARLGSLRVQFDCSASQDSNGGITSYAFDFGDGSGVVTSASPIVAHSYTRFGIFPISVSETDAIGLSSTLLKQIYLAQYALIQGRPTCGCEKMTVTGLRGNTTLSDSRRPNPTRRADSTWHRRAPTRLS